MISHMFDQAKMLSGNLSVKLRQSELIIILLTPFKRAFPFLNNCFYPNIELLTNLKIQGYIMIKMLHYNNLAG